VKWRVNVLALVGATVGLVAVFSTWFLNGIVIKYSILDVITDPHPGYQLLLTGFWVFLVGTLVCFLSPLGGILEIAGAVMFIDWFVGETDKMPSQVGAYIGIISAVIALVSIVKPFGLGYAGGTGGVAGRLLVFSPLREPEAPSPTPPV
jgi:hypothetical protein